MAYNFCCDSYHVPNLIYIYYTVVIILGTSMWRVQFLGVVVRWLLCPLWFIWLRIGTKGWAVLNAVANLRGLYKIPRIWAITQRVVAIPYRRFGTTYRCHLEWSRMQEFLCSLSVCWLLRKDSAAWSCWKSLIRALLVAGWRGKGVNVSVLTAELHKWWCSGFVHRLGVTILLHFGG